MKNRFVAHRFKQHKQITLIRPQTSPRDQRVANAALGSTSRLTEWRVPPCCSFRRLCKKSLRISLSVSILSFILIAAESKFASHSKISRQALSFVWWCSRFFFIDGHAEIFSASVPFSDIACFYFEYLPKIMKTFLASRRSSHLRDCLIEFFKETDFYSLGNVGLGIVSTNLKETRPLIFKNLPALAHGLKHSFEPGLPLAGSKTESRSRVSQMCKLLSSHPRFKSG